MASIKAIEQTSVHQIQSGQVIVDLNSVVKELVENSLDAGSTSIEVRFRNHGLDAIEVIDNGTGVAPEDFESIALKHHTSKLSNYSDLDSLDTFGFRGEALSSLCALSQMHIITAREVDKPRGSRLEFEISGKLKTTSTVAAQRGTKVVVENIFHNLPVRKKELEKNIKREYGKVLTLLQAYACISSGVRFSVSNQMPKGAKIISFNTAASTSTRDNIIKVFGTKSLRDLITLDLKFQLQHDTSRNSTQYDDSSREVKVEGHISRPVFGEGRSAPDRQMFYVNSRPCGLPQVSKAFNDVYKSFNISQSPFVFANLIMDTKSYDVNVSPDKRTILLHDQGILLESLKEALMELFERQEQTVPQSKPTASVQPKLPDYRPLTVTRQPEAESVGADSPTSEHDSHTPDDETLVEPVTQKGSPERLIHNWVGRGAQDRDEVPVARSKPAVQNAFDRMRPQRTPQQVAEITIGDKTTKTVIGSGSYYTPQKRRIHIPNNSIAKKLSQYVMPGTQVETDEEGSGEESGPSQQVQKDADEDSDDEVLFVPQDDSQNSGREREGTPQLGSQTLEKSRTSPIDEYLRITKETDEDVQPSADDLEADYLDEEQNRIREDTKIARMIQKAEDEAARPSQDSIRRATQALKVSKHTTLNLIQTCYVSTASIARQSTLLSKVQAASQQPSKQNETATNHAEETDAEARLSLTVSKSDFTQMNIIGQFNLGFILAVRPCGKKVPSSSSSSSSPSSPSSSSSDLFIIDQHAADEKYNFERYTNSLTLEPQRLAQPKQLHLTAIEEEIVLAHAEALIANGFIISTDTSGASDVGTRCKLLALPMSKETTFDLDDLEELLYLLSDHQTGGGGDGGNSSSSSSSKSIPRPGKVRKMLAMRACRSSIMVGKTLTKGQMVKVVRNLGEMDKPWNCPHGRPTMRHLADLGGLGFNDEGMEKEDEEGGVQEMKSTTDWKGYIRRVRESEEVVSDVDVDVDGEEEEE